MTTAHPVTPWRAGRQPGEWPEDFFPEAFPVRAVNQVLIADVSQFQPDIADAAYIREFSPAIIIRAMYGDKYDDLAWYGGARRAGLHEAGAKFLGIYQYVVAGQDAVAQADALGSLLGSLQPGEKVIADIEEGAGDQHARWEAWAARISQLGNQPWNYSGLNFAAAHDLAPVDWVAAYQPGEPDVQHLLWQFTDSYHIPGIGTCDCSSFHGTIGQLQAYAYGGQQPDWTETLMSELTTLQNGSAGEDVRSAQGLLVARSHPVTVDGSFGPLTEAAVKALQTAAGIIADGVVGPVTWQKLLAR